MPATRIAKEEWEVEQRLAELGTNKAEMIDIARRAVAARADSTEDDPISGPGLLSWIYGSRAMRRTFRAKGWKRNSADNIPSVVNRDTGIKFIFQNADSACDVLRDPKAISDKKKASERLVAAAQMSFEFPEAERDGEEFADIPSTAYYYFVAVRPDGIVTAELSSPRAIEGGQFRGFHERIFIVNPGDMDPIEILDLSDDGPEIEFDVVVTSK
ncbi:hypothetical protein PQI07_06510 [Methylobacterium sp. 092160098-2]|uniref:hypothetical protein n=1 Tax=Methylobacterium sp. 092160098-2 TaxID=3025129 RepID=UPI002381C9CC|nr:hypothetical protein [Methylobacterium sp. 092160098-2]MDE4910353.1 hypothetical protein [Methylobacterium sp. 092160098-2]